MPLSNEMDNISDQDFVLATQTEYQRDIPMKFGPSIQSLDWTGGLCSVLGLIEADCGRSQKHSWDHLLYTRKTSAPKLMRSTKYKSNDIIMT